MYPISERYYPRLAAAYARGLALNALANGGVVRSLDEEVDQTAFSLPAELLEPALDDLGPAEIERILELGEAAQLKFYRFKNTRDQLPRVRAILGRLRGEAFESFLEIGAGRGVFLWVFLDAFPHVQTTAVDLLPHWGEFYETVRAGGVSNLNGYTGEFEKAGFAERSFDVVSLLEVLEHIPDYDAAVQAAVRLARRLVVVTVPSQPDDNPHHLRLFTQEMLETSFRNAGVTRLKFDAVRGSRVLFASVD